MAVGEAIFAGLVLAACVVLLLRLVLSPTRRWQFDRAVMRAFERVRAGFGRLLRRRASSRAAARAADEAIRRARRGDLDREGNVYRPRSFRRPRKPH